MYEEYKRARNKSWEVLLRCGIDKLPVDLNNIVQEYDVKIFTYTNSPLSQLFKPEVLTGDGFTVEIENQKTIYLNDKINNYRRRRFTMAHELGHAILNHDVSVIHYRNSEIDNQTDIQEYEANIFARDLLMPATVLAALNIHTVKEIMNLCNISRLSAEIRLKRLDELYKRNIFNIHPLEKKILGQFKEFINTYKRKK